MYQVKARHLNPNIEKENEDTKHIPDQDSGQRLKEKAAVTQGLFFI